MTNALVLSVLKSALFALKDSILQVKISLAEDHRKGHIFILLPTFLCKKISYEVSSERILGLLSMYFDAA